MSKAGDFGFTAGPFNGDGTAFGYYLTVWRKQEDGAWRWLFEGGIDVTEPNYGSRCGRGGGVCCAGGRRRLCVFSRGGRCRN